jgi:hypothetical protein
VSGEYRNENLSESRPELSAMEAALAELRPRREPKFADDVKGQIKAALSSDPAASPSESQTATVKIPLTRYIRIAQFNAAVGGLLAGLFVGTILGGAGVFYAMRPFASELKQPVRSPAAATWPFARRLLDVDGSLTPLERALLEELSRETTVPDEKEIAR